MKIYQIESTETNENGQTFYSNMLYKEFDRALSMYKHLIEDEKLKGFEIYEQKCNEEHYFCFSNELKGNKVGIKLTKKRVF